MYQVALRKHLTNYHTLIIHFWVIFCNFVIKNLSRWCSERTLIPVCDEYDCQAQIQIKYIPVNKFWRIWMKIYLGKFFLVKTNIFRSLFLGEYEYKCSKLYQKLANMNTNTIIRTDIFKYESKYEYYHDQNKNKTKKQ